MAGGTIGWDKRTLVGRYAVVRDTNCVRRDYCVKEFTRNCAMSTGTNRSAMSAIQCLPRGRETQKVCILTSVKKSHARVLTVPRRDVGVRAQGLSKLCLQVRKSFRISSLADRTYPMVQGR